MVVTNRTPEISRWWRWQPIRDHTNHFYQRAACRCNAVAQVQYCTQTRMHNHRWLPGVVTNPMVVAVGFLDLMNRACGMGAIPKTGQERSRLCCNRKVQSLVCFCFLPMTWDVNHHSHDVVAPTKTTVCSSLGFLPSLVLDYNWVDPAFPKRWSCSWE